MVFWLTYLELIHVRVAPVAVEFRLRPAIVSRRSAVEGRTSWNTGAHGAGESWARNRITQAAGDGMRLLLALRLARRRTECIRDGLLLALQLGRNHRWSRRLGGDLLLLGSAGTPCAKRADLELDSTILTLGEGVGELLSRASVHLLLIARLAASHLEVLLISHLAKELVHLAVRDLERLNTALLGDGTACLVHLSANAADRATAPKLVALEVTANLVLSLLVAGSDILLLAIRARRAALLLGRVLQRPEGVGVGSRSLSLCHRTREVHLNPAGSTEVADELVLALLELEDHPADRGVGALTRNQLRPLRSLWRMKPPFSWMRLMPSPPLPMMCFISMSQL